MVAVAAAASDCEDGRGVRKTTVAAAAAMVVAVAVT
jgi:hypothetical protein